MAKTDDMRLIDLMKVLWKALENECSEYDGEIERRTQQVL